MRRCFQWVLLAAMICGGLRPLTALPTETIQTINRPDDDVRKDIQERLSAEPQLKGLSITVKVDARQVVLSGRIHTLAQRDVALKIAKSLSDGREVIDDFQIIPEAGLPDLSR